MGLVMSMGTLEPHAFERAARGETVLGPFPMAALKASMSVISTPREKSLHRIPCIDA